MTLQQKATTAAATYGDGDRRRRKPQQHHEEDDDDDNDNEEDDDDDDCAVQQQLLLRNLNLRLFRENGGGGGGGDDALVSGERGERICGEGGGGDGDRGDSFVAGSASSSPASPFVRYESRKPLWWRRKSGKATKAQRRAKRRVLQLEQRQPRQQQQQQVEGTTATTTTRTPTSRTGKQPRQEEEKHRGTPAVVSDATNTCSSSTTTAKSSSSYVLERPAYGRYIDWYSVFGESRTETEEAEETAATATATESSLEIWYEIGFGLGDNLLYLATTSEDRRQRRRRRCYFGSEVHPSAIGTAYQRILRLHDDDDDDDDVVAARQEEEEEQQQQRDDDDERRRRRRRRHPLSSLREFRPYRPQVDPFSPLFGSGAETDQTGGSNGDANNNATTNGGDDEDNGSSKNGESVVCTSANASNVPYYNDINNNLRIYAGDGITLLPYVPPSSLHAVLITFPDPFPKWHERQYRVLQVHTVRSMCDVLRNPTPPFSRRDVKPPREGGGGDSDQPNEGEGGGRLYLATDHPVFYEWAHAVIEQFNNENGVTARSSENGSGGADDEYYFQLVDPCPDRHLWLPVISKYEQKGWEEGRRTLLSCWEKKRKRKLGQENK